METTVSLIDPSQATIAGGVAGLVTDVALFPLDTLKTRLQGGGGGSNILPDLFRGLYQGLGPAAVASAPAAAIFFTSYEFMKKHYVSDTPWGHGQAAAVGETAACVFKVPFEVAKQRMQFFKTHSSFFSILRTIHRQEGLRGCYAGFGATLAREIPFGFIQMPVYEMAKRFLVSKKKSGENLSAVEACACGALAGGLAATVTCPIDVWKTRLMLGGQKNVSILSIAKSEGISALFSGLVPRVVWISVGGSLFFAVYEVSRNFISTLS
jgi:solute carrier family 25 S-adenosylmethionine transporter 26